MGFSFEGRRQFLKGNKKTEGGWPTVLQAAQLFTIHIIPLQNYNISV